jgi:hypothetical protein
LYRRRERLAEGLSDRRHFESSQEIQSLQSKLKEAERQVQECRPSQKGPGAVEMENDGLASGYEELRTEAADGSRRSFV